MIVLGGGCEPLSAFRKLSVNVVPGPFDWLGVPTGVTPRLLNDNDWLNDVFDPKQILAHTTSNEKFFGVRDLKYGVSALHHFKTDGVRRFSELVQEQLPRFRTNQTARWANLMEEAQSKNPCFVYREAYPPWIDKSMEGSVDLVYEAVMKLSPHAKLVMVLEQEAFFEKAVVISRPPFRTEYFRLGDRVWLPAWRFLAENLDKLEAGKNYKM